MSNLVVVQPTLAVNCDINGVDFSTHFKGANLSYSSIDVIGQGVSYITGSITLQQPLNGQQTYNYDPRFSTDFTPGKRIILSQEGTANRLPICGTTYIINSNYDFKSTLVINVGCVLSSNNTRSAGDTGLCIDFGALEPVGDVVENLLVSAGVSAININTFQLSLLNKFFIAEPLLIGDTQSLIQAAGALVKQYGYFMYQNKDGLVCFDNLLAEENYAIISSQKDAINYAVDNQPEQAVRKLNLSYGDTQVLNILGATSNAVSSGNIIVETILETNDETRTTVSTITESRDLGNGEQAVVSETVETSVFETASSVVRLGQLTELSSCFPEDQARLLTKETVVTSDNSRVLASWLAYKANAAVPSGFTPSGVVTSSRRFDEYSYTDNTVRIESTTFDPIAKVIPAIGDLQLQSSNTALADIDPETLVPAEKTIELWSRSFNNSNNWRVVITRYLNGALVDLTGILEQAQTSGANLQTIIDDNVVLTQVSQEALYNQPQPTIQTYQVNTETVTETTEIFIGSDLNSGTVENINIGNYFQPDPFLIQEIGKLHFKYENGRIFSSKVGVPLPMDADWVNIVPFKKAKILERNGLGLAYYMDSPSILIQEKEVAISFTGIPLGTTADPLNNNAYSDIITPLPTVPPAVISQLYTFDDLTYTFKQTFEVV